MTFCSSTTFPTFIYPFGCIRRIYTFNDDMIVRDEMCLEIDPVQSLHCAPQLSP